MTVDKFDIDAVRMASHLLPDPGGEVVRDLLNRIEELETPPPGYPDCTSAVIHAMDHPHGETLLKVMHANEKRIAELEAIIAKHDLCHDQHGKVGRDEFEEGCRRETVKEYGSCGWADRIAELEAEAILSDEDAMVQAHDAAERIAELEADVKHLNQMIRDISYGQGQIDVYVAQCERLEELEAENQRLLDEVHRWESEYSNQQLDQQIERD